MARVQHFFDPDTYTLTYLVWDPKTHDAVIIDPVLDYEPSASVVATHSLSEVIELVHHEKLKVRMVLETHAHADHLSGAQWLKKSLGDIPIAIGARITEVQKIFKSIYDLPTDFRTDGSQFDRLLRDEEMVRAGSLSIRVLFTPGHTPACSSYLIDDALFTGDALFMPDYGTGRCDFPAGSAHALYHSVKNVIYALPKETRIFTCHDYLPNGRELRFQSSVEEERKKNIQLNETTKLEDFVHFRHARDKTLTTPRLLYPSVQVNVDAGRLPCADAEGRRYLRIPLFQAAEAGAGN